MKKDATPVEIINVGCDDGFANTDVVVMNGHRVESSIKIPSRARAGVFTTANVMGSDSEVTPVYETGGVTYTVGTEDGESAGFDDYPFSNMNRVVIHHALRMAGLGGKKIRLATGLPLARFYQGNTPNMSVIDMKSESLQKTVSSVDDSAMAIVVEHHVFPEGLAAWVDLAVDENGKFRIDESENIAFIDIGGRTTDIGVVLPGKKIDFARCGSVTYGLLNVVEEVGVALSKRFNVPIPGGLIEKALVSRQMKMFGKLVDISAEVEAAVQSVGDSIMNEVNRKLGAGADLDKVLIVGGGAYVFKQIAAAFPHSIIPDEPELANARGFAKFLNLNS